MKNNTFQNKDLQKNRLQKNITKNQLLQNDTQLIRVLDLMDFGKEPFTIRILNTDQIVHSMKELVPVAGEFV